MLDICVDGGIEVFVEEVGVYCLVVVGNLMYVLVELIIVELG